ncbi:serine/threonine-protein kinase [Streptomyces poonensis]|uniref:Protein kinase domain-containing protein n=1 Tax=Streptomyces poonensis TaxID=68255 RepID=A0A918P8V6_9ACTN|nr:serine/threonine-protein kinase [Streptomyces poonensis]GGY91045.1 hypothetical protein GCM10010365_06810 [Streptomyces poonensis]GLJ87882.1 hypothetical protein GCM10017589_04820 [Streptomyces poonensis]
MQELTAGDPRTLGPFRLTAKLGEGGMGQVFLGLSPGGRRVAVKAVRADIAAEPGFRERFRREVEAARRVGGFWTASVVDADPDAAVPWVASDYIDAPDLARLIERDGALAEPDVLRLAAGLAEALQSVHRAGLVHRDLKPSNVLVTEDGPRVIDFGIAKAMESGSTLTSTGLVIGTPGFMSPEQASGGRVGEPSDIFSLGSVLAHAATGEGPFGEGSVPAILYRVVHDVPRLDGLPPGLLRDVVTRCMAKRPEDRPTAGELLQWLSGAEPPRPRTPTPTVRATPAGKTRSLADTATRTAPERAPSGSPGDGRPVRVAYTRWARGRGIGCLAGVAVLVGGGGLLALTGSLAILTMLPFVILGLVFVPSAISMLRRPEESAVEAGPDGLTLQSRFMGKAGAWHGEWAVLGTVSVKPVRGRGVRPHMYRVLATPPPGYEWKVPGQFRINLTADGRTVRATSGTGETVTASLFLYFPDTETARGELRRLHEALLTYGVGVYQPDPTLLAELRG